MPRTKTTRVGNGMGYGGPPKGAGAPLNKPFEPGNKAAVGRPNPGEGAAAYRRMRKEERIEKLREMLYGLAEEAEAEAVKFNAIRHLWEREDGPVVAPKENDSDVRRIVVENAPEDDG